ncbi:hypothetical protein HNR52_001602 [Thermoanaerobacterium thermosulfurigenes]|nr:hypothetical protein [Thermoanaerobacterium xylanolyticum]
MNKMFTVNATDVRKEWADFINSVVREKPKIIKRTKDYVFVSNIDMIKEMLTAYTFTANILNEDDGTVTISLNEIDIVVNGKDENEALNLLVDDMIEYAEDFYNDFQYWYSAPNRREHLPYVLNILLQDNPEGVKKLIKCQHGKN